MENAQKLLHHHLLLHLKPMVPKMLLERTILEHVLMLARKTTILEQELILKNPVLMLMLARKTILEQDLLLKNPVLMLTTKTTILEQDQEKTLGHVLQMAVPMIPLENIKRCIVINKFQNQDQWYNLLLDNRTWLKTESDKISQWSSCARCYQFGSPDHFLHAKELYNGHSIER